MPILTENELPLYAPNISLVSDELFGAIAYLESVIEGDFGAARPLELQERTEVRSINRFTQSFYLQNYPIADSPAPVISVRIGGNTRDKFDRLYPPGEWYELNPDDYTIDPTGQVFLDYGSIGLYQQGWHSADRYYGVTQPSLYSAYRAVYTAGYDWADTESREIQKLKAAAGKILMYIDQSGVFKGISELDVPFDEFRMKWAVKPELIGAVPSDLLNPFRSLRIRQGI